MRQRQTAAALGALLLSTHVHAQTTDYPSLDLRGFSPPVSPAGALYLEPATTPGPWEWNVGAWASYAYRSVSLEDPSQNEVASVIGHQASLDYFGNVGIGERFAFGLRLPTVLYQTGDDISALVPESTTLPATALGDLSLTAKATLISPSDLGGLGLATIGRLYAPTGNPRSYASDGAVRGELRLLGEVSLLALTFRATAGALFRGAEERLIDDGTEDFAFGHELPWGVGVMFRPQSIGIDNKGRWRWNLEARGAIALTPNVASGPQSPASMAASARYTVDDVSAVFGVEWPLNDAVGVPVLRPVFSIGWAPRFEDADNDLISDEDDECPELAEDRDGFEDADGCPDFDNDGDGIFDEADRCPAEPEDLDGFEDEDGCADNDNDGDGVPDRDDICPDAAGPPEGARPGCPPTDEDEDGLLSDTDRCPTKPEDIDGFEDADGCPDPDNDGDSIADALDRCPLVAGMPQPGTPLHGCPDPDVDDDTFDNDRDSCPELAEDFNGVTDTDGCPDADQAPRAKRLVQVDASGPVPSLRLSQPLKFNGSELDPASEPWLRALAQVLNEHRNWVLAVGVRARSESAEAEQEALGRSFSTAHTVRQLTQRDAADSVSFGAVSTQPGAQRTGVGLMLMVPTEDDDEDADGTRAPEAP